MAAKKPNRSIQWGLLFLLSGSVTLTALTCFLIAYHNIRQAANDSPRMVAEEIAEKLAGGESPYKNWLGVGKIVELSLDSRTYYIIYNSNKQIATTSAMLNGQQPNLPIGVLEAAEEKGENSVTWEPIKGVREAIVVKPYKASSQSGYVVAGRSLARAEEIIRAVGTYIFVGWAFIFSGAVILVMWVLPYKKTGR